MKRLLISFSGGRTSAYMAKRLMDERHDDTEYLVVFANTGQEDERTLEFVDRCNRQWNLGVVWVEAVVEPGMGNSTKSCVVGFADANRDGRVFESVVAKYGIPNKAFPNCNRELKLRPIHHYARSIGWATGSYDSAIGIRADEADRQVTTAAKDRLVYPLIRWGVTKADVLRWWAKQPFDLAVPEHRGNCVWCWKKTLRKHLTLAAEDPAAFAFAARLEAVYPFAGASQDGQPRRLFRGNWTTADILARARLPFKPWTSGGDLGDAELDRSQGCSESCDIYSDDATPLDLFAGLEAA